MQKTLFCVIDIDIDKFLEEKNTSDLYCLSKKSSPNVYVTYYSYNIKLAKTLWT